MRERSLVPFSKPHRKLPGRRKARRPRIVVLGRTRLHIECVAKALGTSGRFEVSYSESVSESNKGIPSPDVIIVDLRLKVTPAAVRDLKARFPKASLLGTGGENDEEVVLDLVRAGLDTVLLQDAPLRALREPIERCL